MDEDTLDHCRAIFTTETTSELKMLHGNSKLKLTTRQSEFPVLYLLASGDKTPWTEQATEMLKELFPCQPSFFKNKRGGDNG